MTAFDDALTTLHADADLSAPADYRQGGQGPVARVRVIRAVLEPEAAPLGLHLRARADTLSVRVGDCTTALQALATLLLTTGAEVWRGPYLGRRIPPEGLIEVAEGEAVEEAMLSPLAYDIAQAVEITVAITADDEPSRDTALDTLLSAIHTAIVADRTLDGAMDDITLGAPSFESLEADGAAKVARIPATLHFHTLASPLG